METAALALASERSFADDVLRPQALKRVYDAIRPELASHSPTDYDGEPQDALAYLISKKIFDRAVAVFSINPWSDLGLTRSGMRLWEATYKIGGSDADVNRIAAKNGKAVISAADWGLEFDTVAFENIVRVANIFAAKWAVHAFQRITTTHTYAAALMCSDADRAVLDDIEIQWHAFMVCVPNGILSFTTDSGMDMDYNRILVAALDDSAVIILLDQNSNAGPWIQAQSAESLAGLLEVEEEDARSGNPLVRISCLAKRLVTGLLLAMQNQNNFRSKTSSPRNGKGQREPGVEPAHRVVFVGAPLNIDCREKVADYIKHGSSRKGVPHLQFLVRGHYKRQVIGIGRKGRKVIWIKPFWKGPENAPILTRPKQVT